MARSALMNVLVQAVLKAGRGLRRDFGEVEQLQVSRKGPGDFVSNADHKAEQTLRTELAKARPDYGFLMEESGEVEGRDPTHRFLVDPLDGTINFLHGIPHFSISVALERQGTIVAGVVYNPVTDELYTAERGGGAFLNDRRLRVAARGELADAVVGCGVPHLGRGDHPQFRRELEAVQAKVSGIRRMGSAALDLAYVAAGRFDAYWERNLNAWDIGAGILLVREAGGFVSDLDGRDDMLTKGSLIAGNETMQGQMLSLLKNA